MSGYIYVIQMGTEGPVKIGYTSKHPLGRLRQLQTGNPYPLRLVMAFDGEPLGEKLFHEAFAASRLEGEWFRFSDELLRAIEVVALTCCGLPTKPPLTEGGQGILIGMADSVGFRRKYPDGSFHWEYDWDEEDRQLAEFDAWLEARGD